MLVTVQGMQADLVSSAGPIIHNPCSCTPTPKFGARTRFQTEPALESETNPKISKEPNNMNNSCSRWNEQAVPFGTFKTHVSKPVDQTTNEFKTVPIGSRPFVPFGTF